MEPLQARLAARIEAWQLHGESLVMLGQEMADAQGAIETLKAAGELIRKGIARCKLGDKDRERALEESLLKARKVQQLRERERTRHEEEELLGKLRQTMELYAELMSQHSKSSLERTYEHFNNKWRLQDPAFQVLQISDYLLCPISKTQILEQQGDWVSISVQSTPLEDRSVFE